MKNLVLIDPLSRNEDREEVMQTMLDVDLYCGLVTVVLSQSEIWILSLLSNCQRLSLVTWL